MAEIIAIKAGNSAGASTTDVFICRYAYNENSSSSNSVSLTKIDLTTIFQRGMHESRFKHAYSTYIDLYAYNHQTDPYSLAIQRLHLSVIPETLPCRGEERARIQTFLCNGVREGGAKQPMYVSGTPGKHPYNRCIRLYILIKR